jgi:hypothetical protein
VNEPQSRRGECEELARQRQVQERIFAELRQEKDNGAAEKKIRTALEELISKSDTAAQLVNMLRRLGVAPLPNCMLTAMAYVEGKIKEVASLWLGSGERSGCPDPVQ